MESDSFQRRIVENKEVNNRLQLEADGTWMRREKERWKRKGRIADEPRGMSRC